MNPLSCLFGQIKEGTLIFKLKKYKIKNTGQSCLYTHQPHNTDLHDHYDYGTLTQICTQKW